MVYALLGNPNSGKTTLFEALCKTEISHKDTLTPFQEGKIKGTPHSLVDLPGLYSLKALTEEEISVIEYLKASPPDAILNVVDLTSPEKDLYLTVSLLTLRLPTVLVLTKADVQEPKNIRIAALEEALGLPTAAVSVLRKEGLETLAAALLHPKRPNRLPLSVALPPTFYQPLLSALSASPDPRLSLLLEEFLLSETPSLHTVNELKKSLPFPLISPSAEKAEALIVSRKKACLLLAGRAFPTLQKGKNEPFADRLFLSGLLARFLPFFALFLAFFLSLCSLGSTLSRCLVIYFDRLSEHLLLFLQSRNTAPPLSSFIVNGLLRGTGAVLSLLPILFIFSFLVSLSKESGYTARAACFFPAPFKKIFTLKWATPFLLLLSFLFQKNVSYLGCLLFVFIYVGVVIYSFFARRFIKTPAKSEEGFCILPPFHMPPIKRSLKKAVESGVALIKRSFSIVFLCSACVWLLSSITLVFSYTANKNESLLSLLFSFLLPFFSPLGISDWRMLVGLILSLVSKESAIAVMYVLSSGEAGEITSLTFTTNALSFFIFILLFPTFAKTDSSKGGKPKPILLSILFFLIRTMLAFFLSSLAFFLISHR